MLVKILRCPRWQLDVNYRMIIKSKLITHFTSERWVLVRMKNELNRLDYKIEHINV